MNYEWLTYRCLCILSRERESISRNIAHIIFKQAEISTLGLHGLSCLWFPNEHKPCMSTAGEALTFHLQFALTLLSSILVDDLAGVNSSVWLLCWFNYHLKVALLCLMDDMPWTCFNGHSVSQPDTRENKSCHVTVHQEMNARTAV